ncbi:uncharacterized protein PRD47_000561 isoform 2-T2 [Ara ararauna]
MQLSPIRSSGAGMRFLLGPSAGGSGPQRLKQGLGGHDGRADECCGQHNSPRAWETHCEWGRGSAESPSAAWGQTPQSCWRALAVELQRPWEEEGSLEEGSCSPLPVGLSSCQSLGSCGKKAVPNSVLPLPSHRCPPSQEDHGTSCEEPACCGCSAADTEWLVFSIAYRVTMAVIFLQRRLSTGISTLKQMTTLRKERLFMVFCLMSFAALAGVWCGTSLLMGQLHGKSAPQGQPAAGLSSLWNTPDVWKGQAGEMQQLRDEVTYLAAEIRSMKKEGQQMREAMSDPMDVSDWALRSTGTAIDLQEASSTSARLRRMFWFLFSQPFEDTFVQPDASPGYCWLMQQPQSEVLIRLPTEVQPTAITLQHCSKIATPLGTVSSAPKDFTASGLDEEGQDETLLGSFIYSMQKEPTQSFPLQVQWVHVGRPGQKHQFASKSLAGGEWTVPGRAGA